MFCSPRKRLLFTPVTVSTNPWHAPMGDFFAKFRLTARGADEWLWASGVELAGAAECMARRTGTDPFRNG